MEQKIVRVPLALVQGIVNYLATRPWAEVNDTVVALSRLQPETVIVDAPAAQPAEEPAKKRVKP